MSDLLKDIAAVIFDVGNTLTCPDWQRITAHTDKHFSLRPDERSLQHSLCKVLREADANADFLRSLAQKGIAANWHFRRVYVEQGLDESQLAQFSDALDALHHERHLWTAINEEAVHVLDELKRRGLRLAVISNSEDGRVAELLQALDIFHHFDLCVDSHLVEYAKPVCAHFSRHRPSIKRRTTASRLRRRFLHAGHQRRTRSRTARHPLRSARSAN